MTPYFFNHASVTSVKSENTPSIPAMLADIAARIDGLRLAAPHPGVAPMAWQPTIETEAAQLAVPDEQSTIAEAEPASVAKASLAASEPLGQSRLQTAQDIAQTRASMRRAAEDLAAAGSCPLEL